VLVALWIALFLYIVYRSMRSKAKH
jgi:hypothetical protein